MRLDIGKHQCSRYWPDVDAYDPYPLLIQVQKRRPASTWEVAARALFYPILLDQLLGNNRYSTALKTRMSGQVGTGNRLMAADEVKDDPPVNVAGGFTCCYLEIGKVNLSHSAERHVDNSVRELYRQKQPPANKITEEEPVHHRPGKSPGPRSGVRSLARRTCFVQADGIKVRTKTGCEESSTPLVRLLELRTSGSARRKGCAYHRLISYTPPACTKSRCSANYQVSLAVYCNVRAA